MPSSPVIITDGSVDFSGGVNSIKVTTIASERNPNGLARNELAWLDNATVRDGGITPRAGYQPVGVVHSGSGYYQGKFLYSPEGGDPYEIYAIGGRIYRKAIDSSAAIDLTEQFAWMNIPPYNPEDEPITYFCQAEQFLIIQAGDGVTPAFFWDGAVLRRSRGITNILVEAGQNGVNEIPPAAAMDYYMGRVWYAQGRRVSAGDIVRGPSGTPAYQFTDPVLNVTESPMVLGGDGFTIPSNDGNTIRSIYHSANIDAALGQGRLFVGTRKAIYALNVPVTRADWIDTTNNNQPLMTVVQLNNGWVGHGSVVPVNGDLFGQSLEPGIRSLLQSIRYFGQWGNLQISSNEQRILQFNDRALLRFGSGVYFNNRLLETALPVSTDRGVVHQAMIPLDFMPISGFDQQKSPNWEGMYEGINILEVNSGDFGGLERAFATILAQDNSIQLWELTQGSKTDNGDNRITWIIEWPSFTWGSELELKKLVSAELWVDRLFGTVEFQMQYRPDGQICWNPWHVWKACSPRNSAENAINPISYPLTSCLESYRSTMTLPVPDTRQCSSPSSRPPNVAYQFQPRLVITGFCRIRGLYLHAEKVDRKLYDGLTC